MTQSLRLFLKNLDSGDSRWGSRKTRHSQRSSLLHGRRGEASSDVCIERRVECNRRMRKWNSGVPARADLWLWWGEKKVWWWLAGGTCGSVPASARRDSAADPWRSDVQRFLHELSLNCPQPALAINFPIIPLPVSHLQIWTFRLQRPLTAFVRSQNIATDAIFQLLPTL